MQWHLSQTEPFAFSLLSYIFHLPVLPSCLPGYSDSFHWLRLFGPAFLYTRHRFIHDHLHFCATLIPLFLSPHAKFLLSNDPLLGLVNKTFTSRPLSSFQSAFTSENIMIFNRSWLSPIRSRFGCENRYEGIREKSDKRPSIFGQARIAALFSLLITIFIFLSLVVCLELYLVLAQSATRIYS